MFQSVTRDCTIPCWDLTDHCRDLSLSQTGDMAGAGGVTGPRRGEAATSFRCSHCRDGTALPSTRPFPTIIIDEIKQRVLGSPLPSRSGLVRTPVRRVINN